MGENCPVILPKCRLLRHIQGSFTCRKSATWDRRLYFPSEGRRADDFFALKNPTASARFELANLGTKGQHAYPQTTKAANPPPPRRYLLPIVGNTPFLNVRGQVSHHAKQQAGRTSNIASYINSYIPARSGKNSQSILKSNYMRADRTSEVAQVFRRDLTEVTL